jgi:hypothetical protein
MKNLRLVDAPVTTALTPARQKLEDLLDQRAKITARIADLQAANGRLNESFAKAATAKAELDAFEARSAEAMLAWSKASAGDAPVIDSATKQRLVAEVAATADQAAAAQAAREQINSSIHQESIAGKALEIPMQLATAEIISETAGGTFLEDLRTAVQTAVAKQVRLQQAVQMIFTLARLSDDQVAAKALFDEAGRLDALLKAAAAPAAPDGAPALAAWQRLATELRSNPAAQLDPNS